MIKRTSEAKSPTKSARSPSPSRSKTASAAGSKKSRTNDKNPDTSSVYTSDLVTEIDSDYFDSLSIGESTAREKLAAEEVVVADEN